MIPKFRAWKDGKCYENVIPIFDGEKKYILIRKKHRYPCPGKRDYNRHISKEVVAELQIGDGDYLTFPAIYFLLPVDFIESSTGRQDKNGKEIYEGDRIRTDFVRYYEGEESKEDFFGTIKWNDDILAFILADEECEDDYMFMESSKESLEVIGNIHKEASNGQ